MNSSKLLLMALSIVVLAESATMPAFAVDFKKQTGVTTSKIDPLIVQWQLASDPEQFAKANGLSYSEGKISVYVYLDNQSSIPKLSAAVNVSATDGNIAVVKATSDEITNLDKLDFVQRISVPDIARPLQNVTRVQQEQDNTQIAILVPAVIAAALISWWVIRHRKNKATSNKPEGNKGDFSI